ncbi:mannose-1-phosphate guanylyltransferase [Winogradskyella sp. A3E31]|uniref:mannose-1-phosphate guanylyltransferase n=1 Tax=Winogradskyella sp. A3E31 TaxID=3349637 RepID=UPI00398A74B1
MKPELKYIELKSGFGDTGPAWIGMAEFSKSGRTVYFNGKALKNSNAQGIVGNFYDIENGDEYWISGIKKNGTDRHWAGGGKIMVDRKVVDLYLSLVDFNVLDKKSFELVDIFPTDKQKFAELENQKLN